MVFLEIRKQKHPQTFDRGEYCGIPVRYGMLLNLKVPINPKIIFHAKEYLRFSEQNAEKNFDFGSNLDFL